MVPIVQHILAVFLVFIAPAWDFYDTLRLKADPSSARKLRYYRTLIIWLWSSTIIAVAAVGMASLFSIRPEPGEASWLFAHPAVKIGLIAFIAVFMALTFLPIVQMIWKKDRVRAAYAKALKPLGFFLPVTAEERRWFSFVCITAGICEELLFRGFLFHYLHASAFHLSLTWTLLLSSLVFAMQHWYMGIGGVIQTLIGGLIFGVLFLVTGNLALPMLLHAASDLRLLLLLPSPPASGR